MTQERRTLGVEGEAYAAEFLIRQGYRILERNVRTPLGEIDLVADDHGTLVVVEVKAIRPAEGFSPIDHLDERKKRKLLQLAKLYLSQKGWRGPVRFDLVALTRKTDGFQVDHLPDVIQDPEP